ncbi:MAG: thioredoxin family protein [Acidobacteria bacterium]|nr:thioredoxin family protein [Acidobacteriota bacterium]
MKRSIVIIACLAVLCFATSAFGQDAKGKSQVKSPERASTLAATADARMEKGAAEGKYVPVLVYDPARNASQDVKEAIAEAQRTNRRVLVEVGGEWCPWCHHMDDFFTAHPEMTALRDKNFVMVKVNYSDENKNEEILSQYPKVAGYPHIFVLDPSGTLLHSQDTGQLEEGKGYNLDKFKAFLTDWATAPGDVKAQ